MYFALRHSASAASCFLLLVSACDKGKESNSSSNDGGSESSSGGDVVVTGQVAIDTLPPEVLGPDGLAVGQREINIKDESGNVLAKAGTASDGTYSVILPGQIAIDNGTGGLRLAGGALHVESIVADTSDQSVVGLNIPLTPNLFSGRVAKLGVTPSRKSPPSAATSSSTVSKTAPAS